MTLHFDEITAPSHWASYLINGDASGYDDAEIKAADEYFAGWHVVDVSADVLVVLFSTDDEWFSGSADLFGSTAKGDTLATYTVQKIN